MIYDDIFQDGRWLSKFRLLGQTCSTRCGGIWSRINTRTRKGGPFQLKNPTYVGATNDFTDFQVFVNWCHDAYGFHHKNPNGSFWSLDKDIIVPGNLSYSTRTCCFVPARINCALNINAKSRGQYPIGVHMRAAGKYAVQVGDGSCQRWIGQFDSIGEAHASWQLHKRAALENLIAEYSDLPMPIRSGIRKRIRQLNRERKRGEQTMGWV